MQKQVWRAGVARAAATRLRSYGSRCVTKAWTDRDSRAAVFRGHPEPGHPPQMRHCNQIPMTNWRARPGLTWGRGVCLGVSHASSSWACANVQGAVDWSVLPGKRKEGGKVNVY